MNHHSTITAEQAGTLDGLFRERLRRTPDAVAYRWHDRGGWQSATWAESAAQVARWQAALLAEGLRPGHRVATALRNCWEWVLFQQAALGLGLVVVPLYPEDRPDNMAWCLDHAGCRLLLLQGPRHWRRLQPALDQVPTLGAVVLLEGGESGLHRDDRLRDAAAWLPPAADGLPAVSALPAASALRASGAAPGDLAAIVYTSGTTGRPKGVMLSHRNLLATAYASQACYDRWGAESFLSILPLSHALELTAGHLMPMMVGATVAFARSIQQLADDFREIRPTVIIAVPRIFERLHERIRAQLAQRPPLARRLYRLTLAVGWRRFERQQRRARWSPALLLWPLLDRLVARPVRERLGGRLRLVVSGGAALAPAVARHFLSLGLPLLQGYGLTETSPVVSVNRPDDNRPASVGPPLPGVEVRIGDGDELLVGGPGVMLGYWRDEAATRAVIDGDGRLHTGDQARLDGRHIVITGRIKDILVLSNGEKIPPGEMEQALTLDPLIDQALVVGEGRPYLTALLVLNGDDWPAFAQRLGLHPDDPAAIDDERVRSALQAHVARLLHAFPGYAKVRRVLPLLEPWTVADGSLTPTLKIKRQVVLGREAGRIEALYR